MRTFLALVLVAALVTSAAADQLVVTGKTKDGTFRGYDKGRFLFASTKGKPMKEQAARVMKVVMTEPVKVTYQTADAAAKPQEAEFKGYDKRAFVLVKDGKETSIPQAKMKTIELSFEMAEGEGGGVGAGGRYPIPEVNLESLAGADITPAQQASIDKFKAAKAKYDDFLDVSSKMVAEMDKATGEKRENLLNQLRTRKQDEQPIKNALTKAYQDLGDAFPEE